MGRLPQITLTIVGIALSALYGEVVHAIDTNKDVTLSDSTGDSPSFIAKDQSGNEGRITKLEGGGTEIRSTEGSIALKPSGDAGHFVAAETLSSNPTLSFKNALANFPGVRLNDSTGQLNVRDQNGTAWQNMTWSVSSKTSDFAISAASDKTTFLVTNATTATLPSASDAGAGFTVSVKRTGPTDVVSVNATGGQLIDGYARALLYSQYATITLVSDGSNWYRFDTFGTVNGSGLSCPTGYVNVPANNTYLTNDFCVAKYEMKNALGVATSQALLTPWVNINNGAASAACSLLGQDYHLIRNNEWMTIARDIEATSGNWSGGTTGSGALNNGHSDNAPANSLAANSDDAQACDGTGQVCSNALWNSQRRTFSLSNGNTLWDLGGNVAEWVDWYVFTGKASPQAASIEINAAVPTALMPQTSFYPGNAAHTSTQGLGRYYPGIDGSGGAAIRGGYFNDGTEAGVFALHLDAAISNANTSTGFRCVFAPGG